MACLCFCVLLYITAVSSLALAHAADVFSEQLLLRPLEDGKVLTYFDFRVDIDVLPAAHFHLFPKSLGQVLNKYGVEELHLSFTAGRWRYDRWGTPQYEHPTQRWTPPVPSPQPGPTGAELWVKLLNDYDYDHGYDDDASSYYEETYNSSNGRLHADNTRRGTTTILTFDKRWSSLQSALSGLFCASLQQIGVIHTSSPSFLYSPPTEHTTIRYGTLPRENVCTENLTPFTKLLPCRNQQGIAKLLHSIRLYDSSFHSLQIHYVPTYHDRTGERIGAALIQNVLSVLDPTRYSTDKSTPAFTLQSLLGEESVLACALARESRVWIHAMPWFSQRFNATFKQLAAEMTGNHHNKHIQEEGADEFFVLSPLPSALASSPQGDQHLLLFDLHNLSSSSAVQQISGSSSDVGGLALSLHYETPHPHTLFVPASAAYHSTPTLQFERYLTGIGSHLGELHVDIYNHALHKIETILYYDSLPWFVRLYFSSLSLTLNGTQQLLPHTEQLLYYRVIAAGPRGRPAELELGFTLPPRSVLSITIALEKSLLSINNEYPPDVSRGFDLPSGVIIVLHNYNSSSGSRTMSMASPCQLYTVGLLVLLPFPDQSMPFNVIAFTSTVIAFIFGSLFNLLYLSHEEILQRNESTPLRRIKERIQSIIHRWTKTRRQQNQQTQEQTAPKQAKQDAVPPSAVGSPVDEPVPSAVDSAWQVQLEKSVRQRKQQRE